MRFQFSCALILLLTYCSPSYAQFLAWQDHTPSALTLFEGKPQAVAALAGDDVLVYSQMPQEISLPTLKGPVRNYNHVQFNTAAVVVSATPAQVKALLGNYSNYAQLFPTLTASAIEEKQNNLSRVRYHISVPIPVPLLSFSEDFTVQHQLDDHSLSALILESPIQYGQGRFEWYPVGDNKTLVTLTQWGDLDTPKGFLISTVLKTVPEIKTGIPAGTSVFMMETLRRKFNPYNNINMAPTKNIVNERNFNPEQLNQIQAILNKTQAPVLLVKRPERVNTPLGGQQTMQFVTGFTNVNASPARTQALLGDPVKYTALFRQINKVDVTPNGAAQDAHIQIKLGLGIISIPFNINLRYFNSNDQAYYQAIGGDIEYMQGHMQFMPINNGQQTRLQFTSASKLGPHAPFLVRLGQTLPYNELMPTVGSLPMILDKAKRALSAK